MDTSDISTLLKRPTELECDVVRFQNQKDKWIAFVGLKDGRPYEIFTGLADDEMGIALPKSVTKGKIIKVVKEDGSKRYDFQFVNTRGFKTTVEGLSYKFDREFWNYAKLISGVLRYGMPIDQVVHMISGLQMDQDSINNWTTGVARVLKRYIPGGAGSSVCCNRFPLESKNRISSIPSAWLSMILTPYRRCHCARREVNQPLFT